jgi:hypothetical protein
VAKIRIAIAALAEDESGRQNQEIRRLAAASTGRGRMSSSGMDGACVSQNPTKSASATAWRASSFSGGMRIRFSVAGWDRADYYRCADALFEIGDYIERAKLGAGLSDNEIAEDLEQRWGDVFPDGIVVKSDGNGAVMVWG